ncbi:MAG: hypothetical protein Q8L78_05990 [Coxiellaceae bacterium]|nr:hypothetical protein [Coxiellaceae bacterium]
MKIYQQLLLTGMSVLISTSLLSTSVFGKGVPVDSSGDTLPSPTGNIPYFSVPEVFAANDSGEYTWDYSGTLENADQRFSFQATIAQITASNSAALDLNLFLFGFEKNGHWFFSNSTYGGDDQETQAAAQSLNIGQSSADLNHFLTNDALIANSAAQWKITALDAAPKAPLYKGWVGQPGRDYNLSGTGRTFLWQYDEATGKKTIAPYNYTFTVTVMDTRGITMEGMANGYVGPQLVFENGQEDNSVHNVESEISQPRLRVLNWDINLTAVNSAQTGFDSQYHFSGGDGMLWNDFGPVDQSHITNFIHNGKLNALIQSQLTHNLATQFSSLSGQHTGKLGSSTLYNGNWIPIEFTRGKYAGASLAFSVFWNKSETYPSDQSTKNLNWSSMGWCNYFSGLIPNEIDSATSTVETLYPENPALPSAGTTETPPYQIDLTKFTDRKYGMAFPWAQEVTITIKANTPLRYALASYADQLAKSTTADDPSKDIVITVSAISPITQNTVFSSAITQFYEGAAIPKIDGQVVGYSWIEHMV